MKSSSIATIDVPFLAMLSYLLYIALGMAVGIGALIAAGRLFDLQFAFLIGNTLIYAGAIFAHFRFAAGTPSWPKLEQGEIIKTIAWASVTIFLGYFAIIIIGSAWQQDLQGLDDALHLRPEVHLRSAMRHFDKATALTLIGIDGCIVAPIAEEILFRSGVYRMLKGRFAIGTAVAISAAIFSLSHRSVSASVPLFVMGSICCWIYEKTGDIRGSIIFHAGYNALVYAAAL